MSYSTCNAQARLGNDAKNRTGNRIASRVLPRAMTTSNLQVGVNPEMDSFQSYDR